MTNLLIDGVRVQMAKLAALKKLDLSQNGLHEFPEALCSLPALADLALDRNYLEGLSPAIGQLSSLTRLRFAPLPFHRSLSTVPWLLAQKC